MARSRARSTRGPASWPRSCATPRETARRRHFRARPHDELDAVTDADAAADGPSTEEALARAEEHVRLRACVNELCDVQKAVVTLRMLEELPGEDVARALGISPGHVAVLLHRAKGSLRVCMTGMIRRRAVERAG